MSSYVIQNGYSIDMETRSHISKRYHTVTKAVNLEFWNSTSDSLHSVYVGSYGRGTAVNSSDLDILIELPKEEYNRFDLRKGNGQSRLLQAVKSAIHTSYPRSDIHADGQVVVISFSDGMKFEILPAFSHTDFWGKELYTYPDTNMGGNWRSTNPKAEQKAMHEKNSFSYSNGLLFDTCKHIRYIHNSCFSSYHLSGIVIDSFVYNAIGDWHWLRDGEIGSGETSGTYESILLTYYNTHTSYGTIAPSWQAPGSGQVLDTRSSISCLGKVLNFMVKE